MKAPQGEHAEAAMTKHQLFEYFSPHPSPVFRLRPPLGSILVRTCLPPNLVSFPSKTGQDIFWAIRHYSLAIIHHAAGG